MRIWSWVYNGIVVSEVNGRAFGGKKEIYLCEFFHEAFHKTSQNVPCIADFLRVLSYDPYKGAPCGGFVEFFNALAKIRYDTLVSWIFPEYVFDHHDRFLHHVVHFGIDQLEKRVDASFRC